MDINTKHTTVFGQSKKKKNIPIIIWSNGINIPH